MTPLKSIPSFQFRQMPANKRISRSPDGNTSRDKQPKLYQGAGHDHVRGFLTRPKETISEYVMNAMLAGDGIVLGGWTHE